MLDFCAYKASTHQQIAFICSGLVFIILACAEASFRGAGMDNWIYLDKHRLYFLIDWFLAYFWGIFFHNQLLELWYSNPTSLLQLRPSHCCLDCSNDVGYFPVITLLIGLKTVLVLFFKVLLFSDCTNNGLSAIACSLFFAVKLQKTALKIKVIL